MSMPTLQRYKKFYQGRIPSVGSGRKQRYPENALPVFDEIRNENIGRRGRPRKDASAAAAPSSARRGRAAGSGREAAAAVTPSRGPGRPARAGRPGRPAGKSASAPAAVAKPAARRGRPPGSKSKNKGASAASGTTGKAGTLMTLTQISEQTVFFPYPTLVRWVPSALRTASPHEGKRPSAAFLSPGRRGFPCPAPGERSRRARAGPSRRQWPRRGGPWPGRRLGDQGGLSQRLKIVEKAQQEIEKRFRGLAQTLQKLFR